MSRDACEKICPLDDQPGVLSDFSQTCADYGADNPYGFLIYLAIPIKLASYTNKTCCGSCAAIHTGVQCVLLCILFSFNKYKVAANGANENTLLCIFHLTDLSLCRSRDACKKISFRGLRPGLTQSGLYIHKRRLAA